MTIDIGFARILLYLLMLVRLLGMLLFNPLLSRSSIPSQVRIGLVLMLTLMLAPQQPDAAFARVYDLSMVGLIFAIFLELAIGLVYGYVFQVFYYMLFYVGDVIDTDIGISMAKTFDPMTNIQTGFSSSMITLLFALYIFATGSHLTLFHIFADSFSDIPVGTVTLSTDILSFALRLTGRVFSLALRLAVPIMVAEFILQFSMGVLMKFIPQITVFVINFQLRILLGLIMLYTFAPYIGQFVDGYIDVMFGNLVEATEVLAGAAAA